jgi:regulator of protease activity HflC (stomatin/prohibitin superfamily)
MGELVRLIIDCIAYVWPFRKISEWEQGCYYVCGRYWKTLGRGVYPVVPWFFDVIEVSMVPAIIGTGRQDLTLKDGRTLSFSATAWARVTDAAKATNGVDDYRETTQELLTSVLADKLVTVDVERLETEKRGRLLSDLQSWAAKEAEPFGIDISKVRFTSFILGARTYRVVTDQSAIVQW